MLDHMADTLPPLQAVWQKLHGTCELLAGVTYTPLRLAGGTMALRRRYTAIWP